MNNRMKITLIIIIISLFLIEIFYWNKKPLNINNIYEQRNKPINQNYLDKMIEDMKHGNS